LERRATLSAVALLLLLAGLAWWSTLGNSREMSDMAQGFAHVGTAMPFTHEHRRFHEHVDHDDGGDDVPDHRPDRVAAPDGVPASRTGTA